MTYTFAGTENNDDINYGGHTQGPPAGWPADQPWVIISGLGGDDKITGTNFSDYISGGDGNDQLYGGAGDDLIAGDAGDDYLSGGSGNDILDGDAGNDTLSGGSGNDWLNGWSGNDTLYGDGGDDFLYGDTGTDILAGGTGNDTLYGGAGNDQLYGEAGHDHYRGGTGNDRYYFNGQGLDTITEGEGEGGVRTDSFNDVDRLYVNYTSSELVYLISTDGEDLLFTSVSEIADGVLDNGVVIDGFFNGGHYRVEYLHTSDGYAYDLGAIFGVV